MHGGKLPTGVCNVNGAYITKNRSWTPMVTNEDKLKMQLRGIRNAQ